MVGPRPKVAIIVAHPDDEIMWAGGTMVLHPGWEKTIVTVCRGRDPDRAPKFRAVADYLQAVEKMADLDDTPEQPPLSEEEVRETVRELLKGTPYDLLLTHAPKGEYTRHRRHEEVSHAVTALWRTGEVPARGLWWFAYHDNGGTILPYAHPEAHLLVALPHRIWQQKYALIHDTYGFAVDSWEARVTPRREAFWCFSSPDTFAAWRARKDAAS